MIKSMTGYGRAEGEIGGRCLAVELKTVNHRFLNFFAKLPGDLQRLEADVLALVKENLQRGQVNVFAVWVTNGSAGPSVNVNAEAAREAVRRLREVAQENGLAGEVCLDHVLAVPAVLSSAPLDLDPEALWKSCGPVFAEALRGLDDLRTREGENLAADVGGRLRSIEALVARIEELRPVVMEDHRARLLKRVEELGQDLPADVLKERVVVEVALYADRSDISEEIVRLRSHLEQFQGLLTGGGVVGRKLEFLLQEMNREANTIGSKSTSAEISRAVVEIKSELEKIREQLQNIE